MDKRHSHDISYLYKVLVSLKTMEECEFLLNDLCTIQELESLAQRLEVATMLHMGMTYAQICEKTGASTATISRVNRALIHGSGGYKLALERMGND